MRRSLWLGVLFASASMTTSPALAQDGDNPRPNAGAANDEEQEIVVTGQKPRGSVIGDIQPEVTFNAGDVRALGVSSVSDLLVELGAQLTSARGGHPVVLLEGRRVSSFREIATIPAEAILRVEILPEEVALKYGYSANQKVMNIVLRQRFRAVTGEAKGRLTTDGGAGQAGAEAGLLTIRRGQRLNLNVDYERTAQLSEGERGITTDSGGDTLRSLSPSQRTFTLTGTYARSLSTRLDASINGQLELDRSASRIGVSSVPGLDAFERTTKDLSADLGTTLNVQGGAWRGTLTATHEHGEGRTISVRGIPADLAETATDTTIADLTVNGNPFALPAGEISLTTRLGGTLDSFRSDTVGTSVASADLDRQIGRAGASVDIPLVRSPSPFVGRISANANAEYQNLSDFGGLTTYGFGLNWSPSRAVGLIASYSDTETAPTMQQLGNPQIATNSVPVFDYIGGQSVLVTRVSGGNPALAAPELSEWRLGLTLRPFSAQDLTVTLSYNNARTQNGISSLPAATQDIQNAFSDRFIREGGVLTRVIATPINIARQDSEILRWGFNFSKRLKTPQSQVDAMRAAFMRRRAEDEAAGRPPPFGFEGPGASRTAGGPGGAGGFPRGLGGPGGPGGGNRVNFAVYHSWHITETAVLRDGLPEIDLLDGGTISSGAGLPRHEVEVQAGITHSGLGMRLTGKWQSPTRVNDIGGSASGDLRFSGLTTVNLRLFANPGLVPGLIGKYRWLRGVRVSIGVNNLFNERQRVTDGTGATPFAYQPGFLDPLGRTVSINVRKLFF